MKRRDFLKAALGAIFLPALTLPSKAIVHSKTDKKLFEDKINFANKHNLKALPIGLIIVEVAKTFMGTPYVGGTLDTVYPEELIINLREVDCFTFVEYVFALALCIKAGRNDFNSFCNYVQLMRYRNGAIKNYASRLHYFTDWMSDGEKKNLIQIIKGPDSFKKQINILSKSLMNKKSNISQNEQLQLQHCEKLLSDSAFSYFPCNSIEANSKLFQNGDVLGFASNVTGLDINHVGFLVNKANQWTFIHASSINKQVEIYNNELTEYCKRVKKNSGIVIGRAK